MVRDVLGTATSMQVSDNVLLCLLLKSDIIEQSWKSVDQNSADGVDDCPALIQCEERRCHCQIIIPT